MANKKFSQFTSTPISSTGFFVGYDSVLNDNIRFSTVPVSNGGTGADNIGDALNTLTNSAGFGNNYLLTTSFGTATFEQAWNIPTVPKQVITLVQCTSTGISIPDSTDTIIPMDSRLTIASNSPFPAPTLSGSDILIPSTMYGYWKVTMNVVLRASTLPTLTRLQASVYNARANDLLKMLVDEEICQGASDIAIASGSGIIQVNGTSDLLSMNIFVVGGNFETYAEVNTYCEMIFEYLHT